MLKLSKYKAFELSEFVLILRHKCGQIQILSKRNRCNKICHNINKWNEIANFQRLINLTEQEPLLMKEGSHFRWKATNKFCMFVSRLSSYKITRKCIYNTLNHYWHYQVKLNSISFHIPHNELFIDSNCLNLFHWLKS